MPLVKSKKKEVLQKVSAIAQEASSVVFVNFHGLGVADTTLLRAGLRTQGVGYTVAKKTLARKAFAERTIAGTMPELPGELAIAYGSDSLAPAREIQNFEKKFEGKLSILGGVFENAYVGREKMLEIAAIPPRDVLLGMFVNLINSPIQRLAIVFGEIAKTKTA